MRCNTCGEECGFSVDCDSIPDVYTIIEEIRELRAMVETLINVLDGD